jgi:hypothetical protein
VKIPRVNAMSDSTNPPANDSSTAAEAAPPKPPLPAFLDPENAPLPKSGWLRRWPWVTVLMPFLVYMLFQLMFESRLADPPKPKADSAQTEAEKPAGEENIAEAKMREDRERKEHEEQAGKIPYDQYPKWYTVKIVATTIAILLVIPGYMYFPWRVHGLAWVVGIVGAVVWVVLAKLQVATYPMLPEMVSKALELGGRPGFNPLEQLKDDPTWMWEFLAIRFFGLVIVVPIIEEFFIRGFLMRDRRELSRVLRGLAAHPVRRGQPTGDCRGHRLSGALAP